MIFKLGEAGSIQLHASSQVLQEIENALRDEAPGTLGYLALLLERNRIEILPPSDKEAINTCKTVVQLPGDLQVIAAAWGGY